MPLTAVERLLLSYDEPDRPMVIRVRLRWDSEVPLSHVESAAVTATRRHPLLNCRCALDEWNRRWFWSGDAVDGDGGSGAAATPESAVMSAITPQKTMIRWFGRGPRDGSVASASTASAVCVAIVEAL